MGFTAKGYDSKDIKKLAEDLINNLNSGDGGIVNYNVKNFSLVGDGVTDDSAALRALLNDVAPSGSEIYFPPGVYLINSAIEVVDKRFVFAGSFATIKSNSNGRICDISSTGSSALGSKWKFVNLNFTGTGSGGNQYAFYFSDKSGSFSFTNCSFSNFGAGGVAIKNVESDTNLGGLFIGCKFYNNGVGVDCSFGRSEYVQIVGCDFFHNTTAISTNSGNILVTGCNINYNENGIVITSGVNDSHGIITGNNVNHNTLMGLLIEGISNGMTLSNNHFYQNAISISDSTGVNFSGGQIDISNYVLSNNVGLIFESVRFGNTYGAAVLLTGTAPFYDGCFSYSGLIATAPNSFIAAGAPPSGVYGAVGGGSVSLNDTFDGLTLVQIVRLLKNKGYLNYKA